MPEPKVHPRVIRCPYCLNRYIVQGIVSPLTSVECTTCLRAFILRDALPFTLGQSQKNKQQSGTSLQLSLAAPLKIFVVVAAITGGLWAVKSGRLSLKRSEPESPSTPTPSAPAAESTTSAPPSPTIAEVDLSLPQAKEFHVVHYAGTLVRTAHGLQYRPHILPLPGRRGDFSCDPTGRSKFSWLLEGEEEVPLATIPVALVQVDTKRGVEKSFEDFPPSVDQANLTVCRLGINPAVKRIHLVFNKERIYTADRPAERIEIQDARATDPPGGMFVLEWRVVPHPLPATLAKDTGPDRFSPIATELSSPATLPKEALQTTPPNAPLVLRVTNGFANASVEVPFSHRSASASAGELQPKSKDELVNAIERGFFGRVTFDEGSTRKVDATTLCAHTVRIPGSTEDASADQAHCTAVAADGTYALETPPGNFKLCSPWMCDACQYSVGRHSKYERNLSVAQAVGTFSSPARDRCVTALEEGAPSDEQYYRVTVRRKKSANFLAGTGSVRFAINPWGEVKYASRSFGTTPIDAIKMAPGKHRFQISNDDLGISHWIWVDVAPAEEVAVRVDLMREQLQRNPLIP